MLGQRRRRWPNIEPHWFNILCLLPDNSHDTRHVEAFCCLAVGYSHRSSTPWCLNRRHNHIVTLTNRPIGMTSILSVTINGYSYDTLIARALMLSPS